MLLDSIIQHKANRQSTFRSDAERRRARSLSVPFGRFRDEPLPDVPSDYLRWLLTQQNIWGWLRGAVERELRSRQSDEEHSEERPSPQIPVEHHGLIEHALEAGFLALAKRTPRENKEARRKLIAARRWVLDNLLCHREIRRKL